jgi:hypothetical protein
VTSVWSQAALVPLALLAPMHSPGSLGDELSGPVVLVDRPAADPGDRVVVTLENFESPWVTVVVCGNEARRGAGDCDMPSAKGIETKDDGSAKVELAVTRPPAACPCVVRALGRDTTELAVVPFDVIGHPVAEVEEGQTVEGLVETDLVAVATPASLLGAARSSLGGSTRYLVTVSVRNRSPATLTNVRVAGDARRGDEIVGRLEFGTPGAIPPGQTWRSTIEVVVGAVSISEVQWQVVTSGAGPTTTTTASSDHQPLLLLVAAISVVLCIAALGFRLLARRHSQAEPADSASPVAGERDPSTTPTAAVDTSAADLMASASERP